jgi:hypothetical protein
MLFCVSLITGDHPDDCMKPQNEQIRDFKIHAEKL